MLQVNKTGPNMVTILDDERYLVIITSPCQGPSTPVHIVSMSVDGGIDTLVNYWVPDNDVKKTVIGTVIQWVNGTLDQDTLDEVSRLLSLHHY